jgi:prolyl-tRNA synthetase
MLISNYFLPVLKETPREAEIISHKLMLKSGMIRQQVSGIYAWLPLGLKVLKNIENIVRKNMDNIGAIEMLMPCVQPASLWIESGRFDNYGKEMLRFQDRHDNSLLFGPTNEDMITDIFKKNIKSYKNLPKNLYHIQWKFRDEVRPRFGVMRGREFLMKDAYSFDVDQSNAIATYNKMYDAYIATFKDLGLSVIPVIADNGPIGGNLSHEFHIIAATGESNIFYDKRFLDNKYKDDVAFLRTLYSAAEERHYPATCPINIDDLCSSKAIEVGHIFYIGTQYSRAMNAYINDSTGQLVPVEMSSYGIGISRLVAAMIESTHDEKGIIWNKIIAPFKVSLINLNMNDSKCTSICEDIYQKLMSMNIDILYDNSLERAGSKFATHDLIGSPYQIIVGSRNIENNIVELKERASGNIEQISNDNIVEIILNKLT